MASTNRDKNRWNPSERGLAAEYQAASSPVMRRVQWAASPACILTQYLTHAAGEPARSWTGDAAQKPGVAHENVLTSVDVVTAKSIFCGKPGKPFIAFADLGEMAASPYAQAYPAISVVPCGAAAFWNICLLSNVTGSVWGFSQLYRDHMPSAFERARRWQQLAEEASSIARQMNDPEAIQTMREIVQRYEILAEHARKRTFREKPKDDLE